MISAKDVLDLLHEMGRTDITLEQQGLVTNGILKSLEIFRLITLIEDHYQISFDTDDLTPENLSSCDQIASLAAKVQ